MKFLILHDNGVWVRDIMVSELLVTTLGLDGPETSQEYPTVWYHRLGVAALGPDRLGDSK